MTIRALSTPVGVSKRSHAPLWSTLWTGVARLTGAAAPWAPVDLAVLIGVVVEGRDLVELRPVIVAAEGVQPRVGRIAWDHKGADRPVPPSGDLGGDARLQRRQSVAEGAALRLVLAAGISRRAAPIGRRAIEGEAQPLGDGHEQVGVRRMQPAAAEIQRVADHHLSARPAADAVAGLEHPHAHRRGREARGGRQTGRTRANDSDVDFVAHPPPPALVRPRHLLIYAPPSNAARDLQWPSRSPTPPRDRARA
jgi:hypothetical protein